jgi:phosphoglycerate kinase
MAIKSVQDIDIKGKRILCRVDFNAPLDSGGSVRDDTRIKRALPTIRHAREQGARLVLMSHLGRPGGEKDPSLSLSPVAKRLSEIISADVSFADDCIGPEVESLVEGLGDGDVCLLENLRFHKGEKKNDPEFAQSLAKLGEVYVNDAFGTSHRAHASTVGVPEEMNLKAAGLLMMEELNNLGKAFKEPDRPMLALFGGAKVSDKVGVLENLLDQIDVILIGGGMANTFLKASGVQVGLSKVEEDKLDLARSILERSKAGGQELVLPVDLVTAKGLDDSGPPNMVDIGSIPDDEMALDIGTRTVKIFKDWIAKAKTIVWNGPMGVFENDRFKMGTRTIARAVGWAEAFTVVGGGDTVRAVEDASMAHRISYISTGGGAFLEFMEGRTLPGVAALED